MGCQHLEEGEDTANGPRNSSGTPWLPTEGWALACEMTWAAEVQLRAGVAGQSGGTIPTPASQSKADLKGSSRARDLERTRFGRAHNGGSPSCEARVLVAGAGSISLTIIINKQINKLTPNLYFWLLLLISSYNFWSGSASSFFSCQTSELPLCLEA